MSRIALEGNALGTGTFTIVSPNSNTSRTLTLPDATGDVVLNSATQTLTNKTLGSGLVAGASLLTSDTAKSATSTSVEFTGIPSWVKRITVMFNGVSTNGTSRYQLQIGSSSYTTSGYASNAGGIGAGGNQTASSGSNTAGFVLTGYAPTAASVYTGQAVLTNITGNTWVCSGVIVETANVIASSSFAGIVALSGTLDRLRITTVNGTDAFDAGTINIMYE